MTDWQLVWLAVMALSLVVMAAMQVGLALIALRVAKQITATTDELRREVRPLIEKTHRIVDDAGRATALAAAQVERLERLIIATTARVDETVSVVQNAIIQPVRQGAAVVAAFRAAFSVFRAFRGDGSRSSREDEDALFVG